LSRRPGPTATTLPSFTCGTTTQSVRQARLRQRTRLVCLRLLHGHAAACVAPAPSAGRAFEEADSGKRMPPTVLVLAATFSTNTRSSSGVNLAASCLDISRCGDGGGGSGGARACDVIVSTILSRPSRHASHLPQMKAVFAVAACLALATTVCGCCLGGVSWATPCRAHSWALRPQRSALTLSLAVPGRRPRADGQQRGSVPAAERPGGPGAGPNNSTIGPPPAAVAPASRTLPSRYAGCGDS
jgi:hypothetical protein